MTDTTTIPVCCTLPDAALRARGAEIEATIGQRIVAVRELVNGYALRFRDEPGVVEEIGRFIAFERVCCAFLAFTLRVAAGDGAIWLELTGAGEAKAFLRPAIERWHA